MKTHGRFTKNLHLLIMMVMSGGIMNGCSNPQSVGIRIGQPAHPQAPVVIQSSGPPAHAPAHGYRKKIAYQYYPSTNVYYDQTRNVYFYVSGSEWEMAASLPTSIRLNVQEAVSLELETERPYEENDKHIKRTKYKGKGKGPKWNR